MWRFLRHTTRLLHHQGHYKQGYYIKVYQGYYVTMTLTNHRTFQNPPTLDAKKCIFAHRRVVRVGCSFVISALKTIVLKNKTKLFFDLQLVNCMEPWTKRRACPITHNQSKVQVQLTSGWNCASTRDLTLNTILDFNVTQMADLHSITYYTFYKTLLYCFSHLLENTHRNTHTMKHTQIMHLALLLPAVSWNKRHHYN